MSQPCEGCKFSHMKCDEQHPICGQCRQLNLECQYGGSLRFVDERVRLERRRIGGQEREKRQKPGQTTFRLQPTNNDTESLESRVSSADAPADILDTSIASSTSIHSSQDPTVRASASNAQTNSNKLTGFFEINTAPRRDLLSEYTQPVNDDILFLVRYFTENIAPWLDLFNHTRYFQAFVPALAQYNPLLRCAVAAVSAKQLSRIVSTENHHRFGAVEWSYKATEIYSEALRSMRFFISEQGQPQHPPAIPTSEVDGIAQILRNSYFSSTCMKERCMVADFVIAASCILSLYESMDSSDAEWSQHLTGVQSLLEAALPPKLVAQHLHNSELPILCHSKRACFWYLARQDHLTAYSKRTRTRLDPYRREIWENAGLVFDTEGFPDFSSLESSKASSACPAAREDLISNILIWILCCIVNLSVLVESATLVGSAVQGAELATKWRQLWRALDILHGNLPMEFEPYGRLVHPASSEIFTEVFFGKPSCAATMQLYHFARLQLLNSPCSLAPSIRDGFAHQDMVNRMERHSREIVSIAAGRPDSAARIVMVHPLYMAGIFLKAGNERKAVARCLQSIEVDLGWRTDYRMKQLLECWDRVQSRQNVEIQDEEYTKKVSV